MSEINTEIVGKVIEGYKVIKPLGQGKFSTVYQAERQTDQKLVALKIIKIFDMMDQKQREKCLQEVKLLQSVDHPNIVKYLDSFICENELYISIEWADKGDLKRLIKKYNQEGDKIDEMKIVDYTRQLASALNHMHEKRIIHRDLKPANILMFSDGNLKLGDLGLGRYMSDETFKAFSKVGTPLYMSPEVIRNDGYDFKTDVWSLGCVIYELITFKSPFRTDEKISLYDLFNKINRGDYPKITDEKYSNIVRDLVDKMLKVNPEERISLEDLIKNSELILKQQDEKPRIDPFIVMEDICEKLRLIDYENSFCKKYKKDFISKFYFACNLNSNSKPTTPNSTQLNHQFMYFYELSYWLMLLIKQNVKLDLLQEFEIKFKKYDKKRTLEAQLNDLLNDLKSMGVKVIDTSKYQNGYGEGVCLILTQLLDKYLINQNFIFKKPKFIDEEEHRVEDIHNEFEEVILEENNEKINTNTQNNFGVNTFNTNFYFRAGSNSGRAGGKKRYHSALSNYTSDTNANSALTTETENFKINPFHVIMESNIDPTEWKCEVDRVEKLLEIPEYPEFLMSGSESSYINTGNNLNHVANNDELDIVKKFGIFSNYFDKIGKNTNLTTLKDTFESIDQELKKITSFERVLSSTVHLKDHIDSIQSNTQRIKLLEYNIQTLENEVFKDQSKLDDLNENLRIFSEKEENFKNDTSANNQITKMKSTIDSLKAEIKRTDTKNSLFEANIWEYHKGKLKESKDQVYDNVDTAFDDIL